MGAAMRAVMMPCDATLAVEQGTRAIDGHSLCPVELCCGRSLPVRLEP
jgi:hypothetical protein